MASTHKCAKCNQSSSSDQALKRCAGCNAAWYCSRTCQKDDWKAHKPTCRDTNTSAHEYWNKQAYLDPDACTLVDSLNLQFPMGRGGLKSGITYPLRRLVATGKDTPENLKLLLGTTREIDGHKEVRKHVLLRPPPGSPAFTMYRHLDEGCPEWAPREPNAREQAEIGAIREMQEVVRRQLDGRKEVTKDDMKTVIAGLGDRWSERLQDYQDAINTMDQGVML